MAIRKMIIMSPTLLFSIGSIELYGLFAGVILLVIFWRVHILQDARGIDNHVSNFIPMRLNKLVHRLVGGHGEQFIPMRSFYQPGMAAAHLVAGDNDGCIRGQEEVDYRPDDRRFDQRLVT